MQLNQQFIDFIDMLPSSEEDRVLCESVKEGYLACLEATRPTFGSQARTRNVMRKRDAKELFWELYKSKRDRGQYIFPAKFNADRKGALENLYKVIVYSPETFGDFITRVRTSFPDMAAAFGEQYDTVGTKERRVKELIEKFWNDRRGGTLTYDKDMSELKSRLFSDIGYNMAGKYADFMIKTLNQMEADFKKNNPGAPIPGTQANTTEDVDTIEPEETEDLEMDGNEQFRWPESETPASEPQAQVSTAPATGSATGGTQKEIIMFCSANDKTLPRDAKNSEYRMRTTIYMHGDLQDAIGYDVPYLCYTDESTISRDGVFPCVVYGYGKPCRLYLWTGVDNGRSVRNGCIVDMFDAESNQQAADFMNKKVGRF